MSRHMHGYFEGELDLAAVALGLAAGSGYIGGSLLVKATDASRAAAVPVLTVGLAEAAIGIGLMVRTGPQVRGLDEQIANSPAEYVREEGARIDRVLSNFVVFRTVETILIVAGAATAVTGLALEEDRAVGAGLGVGAQATAVLCLDALAEARAERYRDAIGRFSASPIIAPAESGGVYGLSVGASF
jgi:hypothetical protein